MTREELIKKYQKDIAYLREGVDWMKSGKMKSGDVSSGGKITDYTEGAIASYERTIDDLEKVVERLKSKDW
jgi:hypothetical protein